MAIAVKFGFGRFYRERRVHWPWHRVRLVAARPAHGKAPMRFAGAVLANGTAD
jgi:hypothetical protein